MTSAIHSFARRMKRALVLAALLAPAAALAQDAPKRELIYGAELMTRAEREQYRQNLERAKGPDEANRVRERHREQIQKRARARGEKLDERGVVEKDAARDAKK